MAAAETDRRVTLTDLPPDFSTTYFKDVSISLKSRQQGYKYFVEGYFDSVKIFKAANDGLQVSAKCYRSQRKNEKPHLINMDIVPGRISLSHCSCTAGASGCCSHIVGLVQALQNWQLMGLKDIPCELSSTSLPQQWSIPRGQKIKPEAVPQMTIIQPKPDRKQKPIKNTINDCRKIKVEEADINNLKRFKELPISYLVTRPSKMINTQFGNMGIGSGLSTHAKFYEVKENKPVSTDCVSMELPGTPPLNIPDKFLPMPDKIKISKQRVKEIEESSREQNNSTVWHEERKTRLTASRFHEITRRKIINDNYLDKLLNGKGVNVKATQYGSRTESCARKAYINSTGRHVHDCGLVINPEFPFLGASPDGRVCDNGESGILEIKCPFSARNMHIQEAITTKSDFCLTLGENGAELKRQHMYFCQVQGQLMITGAPFCDFVVYTTKDIHIERIYPDLEYMTDLLHKLCVIYFDKVRSYLQV